MGRGYKIKLPEGYPHNCDVCPLKGDVPADELQPGDKWTHICHPRMVKMSGRGCKQPEARNRCGRRWWQNFYYSRQYTVDKYGKRTYYYSLSEGQQRRYNIPIQQKLF